MTARGWWKCLALAAMLALAAGTVAQDTRPEMLRDVGIDQRLGASVPLDLVFRDEAGAPVTLGSLLRGKPVILTLVYYRCPMLCTLVLNGVTTALRAVPFAIGEEFDVVTVSIDPRDTPAQAAEKKAHYVEQYGRPGAARGWHFLTGEAPAIERLAQAVGFRYAYDAERQEYAHAAGLMMLTPAGVVARYFYGIEFSPRDLRLGLVESAANRIGSPVDQLLLFCYRYDPHTARYSAAVLNLVRLGGVLTLAALVGFFVWARRRERGSGGTTSGAPAPAGNAAGTTRA